MSQDNSDAPLSHQSANRERMLLCPKPQLAFMAEESPKRILVVDDEPTVCRILTDLLTLDGHAVHIATTPGDAIELCRMRHFDLVFLDYYLPEMTGDKLVGIIKRTSPRQKIVLMTGQRPFPRVGEAEFLIRKPFTTEVVRDVIARFA